MGFIKRPHTCLQLIAHWVKYSLSFNTGMIDFLSDSAMQTKFRNCGWFWPQN